MSHETIPRKISLVIRLDSNNSYFPDGTLVISCCVLKVEEKQRMVFDLFNRNLNWSSFRIPTPIAKALHSFRTCVGTSMQFYELFCSLNDCEVIRFVQCVEYGGILFLFIFYTSPFCAKRCNYREYYACRLFTWPRALTTQYGTPITLERAWLIISLIFAANY